MHVRVEKMQNMPKTSGATVVLGMFDGMHLGHRMLVSVGKKLGGPLVMHTFFTHPRAALTGKRQARLMTNDERIAHAAHLQVDELRMMRFTEETAKVSAMDFLLYIHETLRPKHIIAGQNHRFGKGGEGNSRLIVEMQEAFGYKAHIIEEKKYNHAVISSTAIRDCLEKGDIHSAGDMLGHSYSIAGHIEHGRSVGRDLGFPTANIHAPSGKLLPKNGVYACWVELRMGVYPSVVNIGMRPTFDGHNTTIEAHLLDFVGNIYGEFARVHLVSYLRGEMEFKNTQDLSAQIGQDICLAKKILR